MAGTSAQNSTETSEKAYEYSHNNIRRKKGEVESVYLFTVVYDDVKRYSFEQKFLNKDRPFV